MRKYTVCACCGKKYKNKPFGTDMSTICPNCNWEDDPYIKTTAESSYANHDLCIDDARRAIESCGNIWGFKLKWYQRKAKLYFRKDK